jgi:serine/threonine protein kinase
MTANISKHINPLFPGAIILGKGMQGEVIKHNNLAIKFANSLTKRIAQQKLDKIIHLKSLNHKYIVNIYDIFPLFQCRTTNRWYHLYSMEILTQIVKEKFFDFYSFLKQRDIEFFNFADVHHSDLHADNVMLDGTQLKLIDVEGIQNV